MERSVRFHRGHEGLEGGLVAAVERGARRGELDLLRLVGLAGGAALAANDIQAGHFAGQIGGSAVPTPVSRSSFTSL